MPRKRKSVADTVLADDAATKAGAKRYKPKFTEAATAAPAEAVAEPKKKNHFIKKQRRELQTLSADGDLIDIWERRMLNPGHTESLPVRISTPGMRLRWINLSHRGRFQRARYEQGWVPVHKSELVDEREIFGVSYTSEGYVCRGEKQGEMLMKMPQAVYKKIMERRADLNQQSYKNLRRNMAAAGGKEMRDKYGSSVGDQAEEAAGNFVGDIKFGTEKAASDELFD